MYAVTAGSEAILVSSMGRNTVSESDDAFDERVTRV